MFFTNWVSKSLLNKIKSLKFLDKDQRSVKLNKNILIMIIVRGLSVLVSLLFVPLYLKYIDRGDYGILITLTSMISWIGMLDIGFGNGLRNKLTISLASNNYQDAKRYVSNAYAAITFYVVVVIIIFLIVSPHLSWASILNVEPTREHEMYILVNAMFVLFGLNFTFSIINTIFLSIQEPAIQSIINLVIQIISFGAVFVTIFVFSIKSLLFIGLLNAIISPLILCIVSIYLFLTRYKYLRPSRKLIEFATIKEILAIGIKFFILQVITLILFSVNNVLILHLDSSEAVVEYSIAYRYIDVLAILFTIFITPVWSASTDAYFKSDFIWIRKIVRKMLIISILIILGGTIMIVFSEQVFKIWLGDEVINVNMITLVLVLVFVGFRMLYQSFGYIINGTGKLKAQMVITAISAFLYIPLAIFLGKIFGLYGILIVSALAQVVNFLWSQMQYKHIINKTGGDFWHA